MRDNHSAHPCAPGRRLCAWLVRAAVALAALSLGCSNDAPSGAGAPASATVTGSVTQTAALGRDFPPPKTVRRTTSGEIALGNLNGQIRALSGFIVGSPDAGVSTQRDPTGKRRRDLIELLALRAEMAGQIADLERAAELAEALPAELPDKPEGYLTRASLRSALHRFDEAWQDLDAAEARGKSPKDTRGKRIAILEARGRIQEAIELAQLARKESPSISTIGVVAVLLGELDRREEALAAFREAFEIYNDTSPFPVAWLFFRQGQFWEREGRKDLAIAYYQAATERLPAYAHAAAHHARLAPAERAEEILGTLTASSDDPEIEAVLAEKAKERKDTASAQAHAAKAAARYDELVLRHPAAFADHAAQFWLDAGGDPKRALDLARKNLTVRKTPKAYELSVLCALSAGDKQAACELGTAGIALPGASSMFREIVKGACSAP